MNDSVIIASNIDDANFILNNKSNFSKIYAFTPNVYNLLKNKNFNLINPDKINFDEIHKKTIIESSAIDNILIKVLQKLKISESSKEYIKFQINVFMSSYIFIFILIKSFDKIAIINNNKYIKVNNPEEIIDLLFKKIFQNKSFSFFFPIYNINKVKNYHLNNFYNIFLKFFIKNKLIFLSSGENYGMQNLNDEIIKSDNNKVIIKLKSTHKYNLFDIIRKIYLLFTSKKKYELLPFYNTNNDFSSEINFVFNNIHDKYFSLSKVPLSKILIDGVNYIENTNLYFFKYFKNMKIESFFTHELKMCNSLILAELSKQKKANIILTSHGVHSYSNNFITKTSLSSNANGMLFSPFSNYNIIQSKISEKAFKSYSNNTKTIKSFPLMWGDKNINSNYKKFIHRKEKIILHASTFKSYFVRPWIYESPFEYILSVNQLIDAVKKFKDVTLVIRVRPTPECSFETLKKLIKKSNNVFLKKDGSFIDDLKKSSLLISFSSTTIEEALYYRVPVAIYGYSDRFNHFEGFDIPDENIKSAIYILNKKKLFNQLNKILVNHYNNPLSDNDLSNYIWNKKEVTLSKINDLINLK